MDRENAFGLVSKLIKNKNLVKHSLAVEAIMRDLASDLNEKNSRNDVAGLKMFDEEKWAIAGLVHDIDYEDTVDDPLRHSLVSETILRENGFDEDIIYAVKAHNDTHGLPLNSQMDIALFASDPVSGLITASALINIDKKLYSINPDFVVKRYREKSFAKGANRKQILACEKLGYTLEEFLSIALNSMKKISEQIGL
jgi:uncharacterized protein